MGSKKVKISLGNLVTVFLNMNRNEKAGREGSTAERYDCLPSGSGILDRFSFQHRKKKVLDFLWGKFINQIYQGVSIKEAHFKGRKMFF